MERNTTLTQLQRIRSSAHVLKWVYPLSLPVFCEVGTCQAVPMATVVFVLACWSLETIGWIFKWRHRKYTQSHRLTDLMRSIYFFTVHRLNLLINERAAYSSKRHLFAQSTYLFHSPGSRADQIASKRTVIIQTNYSMCHNF